MTNSTTNPDLIAAIKKLHKYVPWYEWCDLELQAVNGAKVGTRTGISYTWSETECPPACEAAVVMWAEELMEWAYRHRRIMSEIAIDLGGWSWRCLADPGYKTGIENKRVEAAIAIIIAIAAGLEK